MSERKWTLVVVPPGSSTSKVIEVSQRVLKTAVGFIGVFVLVALLLGYGTMSRSIDLQRSAALEKENARLAEELGRLHGEMSTLSDTLKTLAERDARIRLLANLEPNDPAVQQAGIGGPAAPPAKDGLASVGLLGQRAEEVRVDLGALIRRANLLAASFDEATDSLARHRDRLAAMPSIMPTTGWLTSAFSSMREHPILHIARPHEGIDVTAPMGAPIQAPAGGRVTKTGWESGYGNVIVIDHGFGLTTKFAHCSRLEARTGQQVKRGDVIAYVGNTGLATGPHLHYEVHVNGKPVDPLRYVLP
ncbi:MAG TPA: peptidoglycan DD-metalloendopeptidase family protein, partial [Gemmatimonadales bacterium]|nr:peptidoglycan DD-metalloendopeptidase family protein [Gemmatimonadales bacterium]